MTMNSRGFPKSNRNSNAYNENNAFLNLNDNYYPESSSRNYNTSRELQHGIFTSQLNKRDVKKKQAELALEIQEVTDYSANKRVSSKRNVIGRQSRDEYFRQSEASSTQNVEFILKQQLENVKAQIYQNVSQVIKEQGTKYDKALLELVTQINTALKKKQENYYNLRVDTNQMQQSITKLANNFQVFSKQNQEKLQTLVNQMATVNSTKKSKAYGDYGVDLKNSFQGMNSSYSINLGNENSNSKLVNEVIYQLDSLKKQLNDTKVQIQEMDLKLCSKIKNSNSCQTKPQSVLKEDIVTMIEKKIKEQKKSWKLQEKYESYENKLQTLHQILQKQEQNIFEMNQQLKNTINNQMNPKIKKIQSSIVDIYSKIDPLSFDNQIREGIIKGIDQKLKDCKLLKIRNCTKIQSSQINSITGMNEDKITSKETYLIDQQNYLLDSQGNYLVQTIEGAKSRVKLQPNLIYLLGLKGIQIAQCS